MRPDDRELDDEIRGHLALSVKERIERGEDPEAARLAALREFGYVPAIRDSMRRVWYSRWLDAGRGPRAGHAGRPALAAARQGPGRHRRRRRSRSASAPTPPSSASSAACCCVRWSIATRIAWSTSARARRASAPTNTTFSVPEIDDFKSRVTTITAFGDFSTIDFTLIGLGEPRVVQGRRRRRLVTSR